MVSSKGHIMQPHIFQNVLRLSYAEVLDNLVNTSCMWCKAVYVTAGIGTCLQISGDIGWRSMYTTISRQTCSHLTRWTWTPLNITRGALLKARLINFSQYNWFYESRHYPSNVQYHYRTLWYVYINDSRPTLKPSLRLKAVTSNNYVNLPFLDLCNQFYIYTFSCFYVGYFSYCTCRLQQNLTLAIH